METEKTAIPNESPSSHPFPHRRAKRQQPATDSRRPAEAEKTGTRSESPVSLSFSRHRGNAESEKTVAHNESRPPVRSRAACGNAETDCGKALRQQRSRSCIESLSSRAAAEVQKSKRRSTAADSRALPPFPPPRIPDGENVRPKYRQTRLRMYDAEPLSLLFVRFFGRRLRVLCGLSDEWMAELSTRNILGWTIAVLS